MIGKGRSTISLRDILNVTDEATIAHKYLGINKIPCVINSPLRKDSKPSFGLYSPDGVKVCFVDFSTGEKGNIYTILSRLWDISYDKVIDRLYRDFNVGVNPISIKQSKNINNKIIKRETSVKLEVKVRPWKKHDIEYWESYGITLDWLKFANVYPISHKFITKDKTKYTFAADKYAYAFIENKEDNLTIKIYQPFNKDGYKWATSTDSSVISLWTKLPETGSIVCVCSSLKDALCLWSNVGIPSVAPQGEGYSISDTAKNELYKRFNRVYICFDRDKAGIKDAEQLAAKTGFKSVIIPDVNNAKDISDLYKEIKDKEAFRYLLLPLFN